MQAFREMPFVTGLEGFLDINCVTTYVYAVWNLFTSGSCAKKKGLKLAGKIAYFVNFFLFSNEKKLLFLQLFLRHRWGSMKLCTQRQKWCMKVYIIFAQPISNITNGCSNLRMNDPTNATFTNSQNFISLDSL